MSDYIKREDAVRRIAVLMAVEAESDGCEDQPMDNYIEYALEDLADIPSADVAPVRHGRWKPFDRTWGRSVFTCTACGDAIDVPTEMGKPLFVYCPNCGAHMMDEEEDV